MPERKDSVDSFDDFFGGVASKNDSTKPKAPSPVESETNGQSISALIRTQPTYNRQKIPEERSISPVQTKPKVIPIESKPSTKNDRPPSIQSKVYESDFDDDEAFEDDDETVVDRKQHSSDPQPKVRASSTRRRGSESDVKRSYALHPRRNQLTNGKSQRRDPMLPIIRPTQPRRPVYQARHRNEILSSSTTSEQDKRILSAQSNKLKSLESRIAALGRELEAQRIENATLRTIQRREEKAIKRYEEKEYDIHRIVRDYNHEIEHVKRTLSAEREVKQRLEKQMEGREEKLREQNKRLKKYEKIVQEKNLDERYELQEKIKEIDKKLQEQQEKLSTQEKYIDNLEKNHRHEIKQEMSKQRQLKRDLEERVEKYNELLVKFEDRTRQVDTMHIYAQRVSKPSSDSPPNLTKSRSLQSLHDTSPRLKEKTIGSNRKRREKERSAEPSSTKVETKKPATVTRATNDVKQSNKSNGNLPPKAKPLARRLSTPESIQEEILDDNSNSKKMPTIERDEKYLSQAQIHKRSTTINPSKPTNEKSGGGSSIFKLTEPPALSSNTRPKRDLDEKWTDMFGSTNDAAKDDLLSKLVADEQKERRLAAAATNPRSSTITYEPSTRTATTVKPAADPFDSLFGSSANRPTATRTQDLDDIFSTKPSTQTKASSKNDPFDSLFGNATSSSNANDKLQRSKAATNGTKSIPNRTIFDEVEELVI